MLKKFQLINQSNPILCLYGKVKKAIESINK